MFRLALSTLGRIAGNQQLCQKATDRGLQAGGTQQLHATGCQLVLHKDHPGKKSLDRLRQQQEQAGAAGTAGEEGQELEGLKFDSIFPTAETHAMVINGMRYDEIPIVHIKATHNNTIITVTDGKGSQFLLGLIGFRNAKKGTNIAAQAAALALVPKVSSKGVRLDMVRVSVKGIGPGRLPAIKGLQMSGLTIVSITDATLLPFNGLRPKKQRRL